MMHIENAPTECPNCGSDFLDEDRAGTADLTIWCYDCDWTVTADEDDMSITVSKWTTKNIGDPEKKTTDIGDPEKKTTDIGDPGPLLPGFA